MRRSIVIAVGAAVLAAVIGVSAAAAWFYTELRTPYYGAPDTPTFIEIPRGLNTERIADLLVRSGVLRRRLPFILYARFTDNAGRIKAGEYRFADPATPEQILERLAAGDVYFRAVTVPEGLTAVETLGILEKNGFGSVEEMLPILQRTEWIEDLSPGARDLEGFLFPETYHVGRKADATAVVRMMVEEFRKEFGNIAARFPPREGWNVERIVTLASMIEKEVRIEEERRIVASVFYNRLERKMPLACDATIIYALKLAGTFDGNIRKADLSLQSPYNTYIHPGLPPGPIANPGAGSLQAALDPAETDYLYYVSRNDGTHEFSKNYASHQRAVDRYQRFRSRRSR